MADKKISQLTSLAQNDVVVSTDVLPIVDTSATETKKIAVNALVGAAAAAGLTNVDINSGTIDGATIATSDITVGSGKTLNVSAGTLTLADNQISGDKVEGGTINAITINTLTSTAVNATTVDATNVEVTNVKAKDGTASIAIADSTGVASLSANPILSGGTANGVLYLNGSKVATSGSALTFDGTTLVSNAASARIQVSPSTNTNNSLFQATNGGGSGYIGLDSSTGSLSGAIYALTLWHNSNRPIVFGVNNAEQMRLNTTGLGIGTTNPANPLHVVSSANTLIAARNSGAAIGQIITGNTAGDLTIRALASGDALIYSDTSKYLAFGSGGSTERMRITATGDVGIGTASPLNRLHVDSGATASTGFFVSTATTAYEPTTSAAVLNSRFILRGGSATNSYNAIRFTNTGSCENFFGAVQNASGVGQFVWGGYNGSAYAEWMRLDSSGNLGIGTTAPVVRTQIVNNGGVGSSVSVFRTQSEGAYLDVEITPQANPTEAVIRFTGFSSGGGNSSNSALAFNTRTSGTNSEKMRITSAGEVGIGTSSPAAQLHIVGNDTSDQVIIENTDATALTAPDMVFYRNSASPAANDALGNLVYRGKDSAGNTQDYARILSFIEDPTSATEDGNLVFQTALNASCDERMRITAAGEMLVGGTTAIAANSGSVSIQRTDGDPSLRFFRDDTTITTGNGLGTLAWYGNDTTSNAVTLHAYIEAVASEVHGAGDNPTDIRFATTPDGTATTAEAGRITQSGSYVLKGGTTTAAAGVGIIFPATQVASANANSLDDYEEGTWTPVVADAASGGNASATVLYGNYTKIGNIVTVTAACVNISTSGLTAGNVAYIRGLPFASADIAAATGYFTGSAFTSAVTISAPPTVVLGDNGQTALNLNDGSAILVSDLTSGSADIWFTLTYQA
jgi:hypothetical protein